MALCDPLVNLPVLLLRSDCISFGCLCDTRGNTAPNIENMADSWRIISEIFLEGQNLGVNELARMTVLPHPFGIRFGNHAVLDHLGRNECELGLYSSLVC